MLTAEGHDSCQVFLRFRISGKVVSSRLGEEEKKTDMKSETVNR